MLGTIKRFFTDETAFKGYMRAMLLGLGSGIAIYPDYFERVPKSVALLLIMAAGMVRAGDKNPPAS